MSINFVNLKGDRYFIKKKLTKKGNTTYYMTKKKDDDCLDMIPEGFEVFKKYDSGMMFIRRVKAKLFKEDEIKIVERELKKNETVLDFKLDVIGDTIKIYTVENDAFSDIQNEHTSGTVGMLLRSHLMSRFEERMKITVEEDEGVTFFSTKGQKI